MDSFEKKKKKNETTNATRNVLKFYCKIYDMWFSSPETCLIRQFFYLCECDYGLELREKYGDKVKIKINPKLSKTKEVLRKRGFDVKKLTSKEDKTWPPDMIEIVPFPKKKDNG